MAPMPQRPLLRTLALLVLGALLTVIAVDVAVFGGGLYGVLLRAYFPWADDQPRRVLATAVRWRPRVVVLGDSRTRQAIRPTLFEETAGLGGANLRMTNAGVIAAPVSFDVVMLRRLLESAPPPQVAIIGIDPSDLYQWPPERVMPQLYDLYRGPQDWPETYTTKAKVELALSSVWPLWRYRMQASEILAIAMTTPPGQGADGLVPRPIPDRWYAGDVGRGWWPAHQSHTVIPTETKWALFKPYPYPGQVPNVRRLLELCRERRIRPILVWLPVYGHTSAEPDGKLATTFLNGLGAEAVIDLSATCQQRQFWQNPTHLNVEGGRAFTIELAKRLGPRLQDLARPGKPG